MRHLFTLALLLSASAAHAVPVSPEEIMASPAGRWLVRRLNTAAAQAGGELDSLLHFQQKYARIRLRYREAIRTGEDVFQHTSADLLLNDEQALLKAITYDELVQNTNWRGAAADFLAGGEGASQTFLPLATFNDTADGVLHFIARPIPSLPAGPRATASARTIESLLAFLDVRTITSRVTAVPSIGTLNARIARLNAALDSLNLPKIPLEFVETTHRSNFQMARWLAQGKMPIRVRGDLAGEDPVATLGAILLTPAQAGILSADFKFMQAFLRDFAANQPAVSHSAAAQGAFAEMWNGLSSRLTANPALHAPEVQYVRAFRKIGAELGRSHVFTSGLQPITTPAERLTALLEADVALAGNQPLLAKLENAIDRFARGAVGKPLNASAGGLPTGPSEITLDQRIAELARALETL